MNERWKKKWPVAVSGLVIMAALILLDQWTKSDVMNAIPLGERMEIIPGVFDLTYMLSSGSSFSAFEGFSILLFAGFTLSALAGMACAFFMMDDIRVEWCMVLVAAGAAGNLLDQILFGGLRNFFLFYVAGRPLPVFNAADVWIGSGLLLLCVSFLYDKGKQFRRKARLAQRP